MKKLAIALFAVTAFTGSAIAADLPARTYTKAPVAVAAAPSWTGCYVAGGGGYGMWNQENTTWADNGTLRTLYTDTVTNGGRGYFGTVQAGCDYQFGGNWVVGAFGDYDFASIKGKISDNWFYGVGDEKLSSQWAVGGRVGYVVLPSLLAYFVGGYTEARFDAVNFNFATLVGAPNSAVIGAPNGIGLNSRTYKGWFLGAGDEYAMSFLPGLFWKTEYRVSQLKARYDQFYDVNACTANCGTGIWVDSRKWEQTVRSELVYRFNWTGPVVAKY